MEKEPDFSQLPEGHGQEPPEEPKASDKVPLKNKVLWGMGGACDNFIMNGVNALVLPIYNVGFGLDVVLVGVAQAIPRFIDAVTDPLMGNISDNTRSRWGRRRPYIFIGSIISALLFIFLWTPPLESTQHSIFIYLLVGLVLYYIAYTVFIVPYTALGYEMTTDYNERTRVVIWRQYIGIACGLAVPWLYKMCFIFDSSPGSETTGVRYVSYFVAFIILFTGILPAVFCKEKTSTQNQSKIKIMRAFLYTLKNKAFLLLMASNLIIKIGIFMAGPFNLYLNIYYVCKGDRAFAATLAGLCGTLLTAMGLVGLPIATWLSVRFGKRKAVIGTLAFSMLGYLSLWFFLTPDYPYLQLIPAIMVGLSLNGSWLLIMSMLGDVCDEDEYVTGLRREGMYSSVFTFSDKMGFSLITLLSGLVIKLSGFSEELEFQTQSTIFNMRVMYIALQAIGLFLGIVFIYFYPLSRQRCEAIHEELETRNN